MNSKSYAKIHIDIAMGVCVGRIIGVDGVGIERIETEAYVQSVIHAFGWRRRP